jgi:class 3 adenylate cyclase
MSESRKLAAILVSDIVGFSRHAGTDEDRILARLRTLRSDLIGESIRELCIRARVAGSEGVRLR